MLKTRSEGFYSLHRGLSFDLEHQPFTLMPAVLHCPHLVAATVLDRQPLAEGVETLGFVEGRTEPYLVEK